MTNIAEKCSKNVASKLQFWQSWLRSKGGPWPNDYRARLNPKKPFSKAVEKAVHHPTGGALEILDVGAGTITSLGYASERFDIRITATLADAYSVLLAEADVDPPVRTIKLRRRERAAAFRRPAFPCLPFVQRAGLLR